MENSVQFQLTPLFGKNLNNKLDQNVIFLLNQQNLSQRMIDDFIKKIITSQQYEDWIVLECLLNNQYIKEQPNLYHKLLQALSAGYNQFDQTYVMRVFTYGWIKQNSPQKDSNFFERQIKQFAAEGRIFWLISWIQETPQTDDTIQYTLRMLCKYFPIIFSKSHISIDVQQLQLIIQIIAHIELKTIEMFEELDRLVDCVKRIHYNTNKTMRYQGLHNQKWIIIKLTMDVLANAKSAKGNAAWLFADGILLKDDINEFILANNDLMLAYQENQLVKIFQKLFMNSLYENALTLFKRISRLYQQNQRYYEMKILYQKIVLPILVRRAKGKMGLSEQILEIGSFYVIGFYEHCDIGRKGLLCLLENIHNVYQQQFRDKWIELALLIAEKKPSLYGSTVLESLEKQKISRSLVDRIDKNKGFDSFNQTYIWQINAHNSRRIKLYPKKRSTEYKGIQNNHLQCYIISVMQALYTTGELQKILEKYTPNRYNKYSFCESLKDLIRSLNSPHDYVVTVDHVKTNGPEFFAQSQGQEDAQQYLLKLFETIEDQFKSNHENSLLDQFYRVFRLKVNRKLQCKNCSHSINTTEEQFIHTIPNKSSLREQHVQQIQDYRCQKCRGRHFLSNTWINPKSRIFMVHFNRFSFRNGRSHKQLPTQPIKRQFMGYRLRGIIFHIGKNVQCGHYLYYFNVGGRRWVEMNDSYVGEFQLQNEDEEFQKEMKAEMTPYVLFYVKKHLE